MTVLSSKSKQQFTKKILDILLYFDYSSIESYLYQKTHLPFNSDNLIMHITFSQSTSSEDQIQFVLVKPRLFNVSVRSHVHRASSQVVPADHFELTTENHLRVG